MSSIMLYHSIKSFVELKQRSRNQSGDHGVLSLNAHHATAATRAFAFVTAIASRLHLDTPVLFARYTNKSTFYA